MRRGHHARAWALALCLAAAPPLAPGQEGKASPSAEGGGAAPPPAWLDAKEEDGFPALFSDTGFYKVAWAAPGGEGSQALDAVLEESASKDFQDARTIYEGPDQATVLSGRMNGVYYYRARWADGPEDAWGPTLAAKVEHHSLFKALAFLGLGAVVFLSTAALIVAGHLAHRRDVAAGLFDEELSVDGKEKEGVQGAKA